MQYFVNFREIDRHRVVTSFTAPSIDPVATGRVIEPFLFESGEHKKTMELAARYGEQVQLAERLKSTDRDLRMRRRPGFAKQREQIAIAYTECQEKMALAQMEARQLRGALMGRRKQLIEEHAVRFEVPGCLEVTQDEQERLKEALSGLSTGQVLTTDGEALEDNRGAVYWIEDRYYSLHRYQVLELGTEIPRGAILQDELTAEQLKKIERAQEIRRISSLEPEARAEERKRAIDNALSRAAQKKTEYEIQGVENALEKSREWYKSQKAEIENLYK